MYYIEKKEHLLWFEYDIIPKGFLPFVPLLSMPQINMFVNIQNADKAYWINMLYTTYLFIHA